ncbi:type IV pilin protein [Neptuniibacter halophilus]|uniref:type IV pilin protein n=1 Tax=Neptuniibacter halophilus TaxID=651666 RepID=UPI00257326A3|nr:type IV pilin protein [Neptuniibacter halophilus]
MRKFCGFSLIELMIVVAVLGIISAVAYPSYLRYVQEARRTAAQGDLLELAQWLERGYTLQGRYVASGALLALPFDKSPKEGNPKFYAIDLTVLQPDSFTLRAQPIGGQADDPCGSLIYDHLGRRAATGIGSRCWDE